MNNIMKRNKAQYGASNALNNMITLADIPSEALMQASNDYNVKEAGKTLQQKKNKKEFRRCTNGCC